MRTRLVWRPPSRSRTQLASHSNSSRPCRHTWKITCERRGKTRPRYSRTSNCGSSSSSRRRRSPRSPPPLPTLETRRRQMGYKPIRGTSSCIKTRRLHPQTETSMAVAYNYKKERSEICRKLLVGRALRKITKTKTAWLAMPTRPIQCIVRMAKLIEWAVPHNRFNSSVNRTTTTMPATTRKQCHSCFKTCQHSAAARSCTAPVGTAASRVALIFS